MNVFAFKDTKRRALALVGAAALSLTLVMPALADNSVSTTILSGGLDASYASDAAIDLGTEVAYSQLNQDLTESTNTLRVDDARNTSAGWSVTFVASDFAHASYANSNIDASNFKVSSITDPTVESGQAVSTNPSEGPEAVSVSVGLGLDSARTIVQAYANFGNGVYVSTVGLTLTVPGYSRPGDYSSTLTVTTGVAPS